MPIPVSFTINLIVDSLSNSADFSIVNVTSPGASVNLTAFDKILMSASLILNSSPM